MLESPATTVNPSRQWIRATSGDPCPVCDGISNCEWSPDRRVVWCGRVPSGGRVNAGGQHLHFIAGAGGPIDYLAATPPGPQSPPANPFSIPDDWWQPTPFATTYSAWQTSGWSQITVPALASRIGTSQHSLRAIGVAGRGRTHALIPERDADERIVGLQRRDITTGRKMQEPGSRRGLVIPDDWTASPGPIVICEGASDVAAALDMGLCAIGRPSASSDAAGELSKLIALAGQTDRPIFVLGERDQKPDGQWPGYNGAVNVARKLHAQLPSTRVIAALPPDGTKDLRQWRVDHPAGKGKDFLSRLVTIEAHDPLPPASLGTVCDCEGDECACTELEPVRSNQARRSHNPDCRCEHCEADIAQDASERRRSCNFRRAIHRDGTIKIIRAKCMSWKCLRCRQVLVEQWESHFRAICQTLIAEGTETIYRHICTAASAPQLLRAIREAGGSFIRVKATNSSYAVYSTASGPTIDQHASGTQAVPIDLAQSLIHLDLMHSDAQRRVVSTSRDWSMRSGRGRLCGTGWHALQGNFNSPEANKRACEIFHARWREFRERDDSPPAIAVDMEIHLPFSPVGFDDLAKAYAELVTELANSWKTPSTFESFQEWSTWRDRSSYYPLRETLTEDHTTAVAGVGPPFF